MEGPSPRVVKETKTIQSDPVPGIAFQPDPTNYKHFFIELQGTHEIRQALLEHATKEETSRRSSFCPTTIPCHLPKSSLIPRSTILTSVFFNPCRQPRPHLSRHSQEELVACTSDEVSSPFHPESSCRTQPRRSS
jgi:hypothetical protein